MKDNGSNSNIYIYGAILGLVVGVLSAYLYSRAAEESGETGKASSLSFGDVIRVGVVIVGALRQIAETAKKNEEKV